MFFGLRKKLNLTQRELAKEIGYTSKVFISKIENDVYLPSVKYTNFMTKKFPRDKNKIYKAVASAKLERFFGKKTNRKQIGLETTKQRTT